MDLKEIEKNYASMPDHEIIRIATTDAHGLRPEVFGIIEIEIKKRNLNLDILKGAYAQNKNYTNEEIATYSKLLRDLPCPICRSTQEKLNGTISHTLNSFILFSTHQTQITIACPKCLNKKNNSALISTALLGWWGFPLEFFETPLYFYRNLRAKRKNRVDTSNETLLSFTLANIGEIETYKDDKEKLKQIITPRKN